MIESVAMNSIIIIENLKSGEDKTGSKIFEDLEYKVIGKDIARAYHNPSNPKEFLKILGDLLEASKTGKVFPLIHLEIHGYEGGLLFGDAEERMAWKAVTPVLAEINQATKFNLFLSMGICHGATSLESLADADSLAPFSGCLASFESEKAGNIAKGFSQFYETLFATNDIGKSAANFRAVTPDAKFNIYQCEHIFLLATLRVLRIMEKPGAAEKSWVNLVRTKQAKGNSKSLRKKRKEYIEKYGSEEFKHKMFLLWQKTFFGGNENWRRELVSFQEVLRVSRTRKER